MRKTKCLLFLLALLILGPVSFAQSPLIVRVTDFPPQYYQDETGEWTGLDVELARALVEEAGLPVRFVRLPWKRALRDLKEGKVHLMTTLAKTAERSAFVHYIGLERYSEMGLVVQKRHSGLVIEGLDDLVEICQATDKRWGIQGGIFYSKAFNRRMSSDKEFAECFYRVSHVDLLFPMTLEGRLIGFFEDAQPLKHAVRNDPEYRRALEVHDYVLYRQPVYFGVSKKLDSATIQKLENAYERLETAGRFQEIIARDWSVK
ncbi:substrate-binding periplasmic protein [Halospina denitrificans]|nr:transporter substrate-binding domain-containing protein [Halospina denitrificans]